MLLIIEKIWRTRPRTFYRMVGEYGPRDSLESCSRLGPFCPLESRKQEVGILLPFIAFLDNGILDNIVIEVAIMHNVALCCRFKLGVINLSNVFALPAALTLSQTSPGFYLPAVQVSWKHCGKRRNCSQRAISPFPTVFSTRLESFLPFSSNLKLSSANSFIWEESKMCRLGKG